MDIVVFKCGGSILQQLSPEFFKTLVRLQKTGTCQPVIVHGGGPVITDLAQRFEVESVFVDGLRVTSKELVDVVEMALSGKSNKRIVHELWKAGGAAWGISGVDGQFLTSEQIDPRLGYVGRITKVNTAMIMSIVDQGYIPVVSPVSLSPTFEKYNVNADDASAAIACALDAKLCYITDVDGVQTSEGLVAELDESLVRQLIQSEVITGGMIPKVQSALQALEQGVTHIQMLNGKHPDMIEKWLKGINVGTSFRKGEATKHAATGG